MKTIFLSLAFFSGFAAAQGSYGFLFNASILDRGDDNGGVILGVLNLDGAGGITGTYTLQVRDQGGTTVPGSLTGTYTINPDGTGSTTISLDAGFSFTFSIVLTDGGKGVQLVALPGPGLEGGSDISLEGTAVTLTGTVPMSSFIPGAAGGIPVTLTGVTPTGRGVTVYTAANANASGNTPCPDGSAGQWMATVPSFTVVTHPSLQAVAGTGGAIDGGNLLLTVSFTACGSGDIQLVTGPLSGGVQPGGAATVVAHKVGDVLSGIGRVAGGTTLNGSYGFLLNYSPFPAANSGVVTFDGAGNATVTFTFVSGQDTSGKPPAAVKSGGTYTVNPDSTGTINLTTPGGQPAGSFAFVITDGGSGLLLLETDQTNGGNLAFGTARLQ